MRTVIFQSLALAVALAGSVGCSSSLSQPFAQLKTSSAPITVYRLQNFEPPVAQAATPATPQLPPELQQWVTAGASLLPPGLLPPGLIPGAPVVAAPQNVARFHNFRILQWVALTDANLTSETYDIFGRDKNFEAPKTQCMYAEFGFSIAQGQAAPADVLVSLSCNQIQAFNITWPYGTKTGLTGDTAKRIIAIAQKTFGN